jgi:MFS family permease
MLFYQSIGFVLSSFYWGYTIGQVPTSILAQIYNCKHIFGLGVFLSAVFTLFVPISAEMSFEFLIFLRFLTGLCESSCFPAVFHFYNAWIPLNEKTFLISYIISGRDDDDDDDGSNDC